MMISGWGNYPRADARLVEARVPSDVAIRVAAEKQIIARGAGRAYGDAAIGCDATLSMTRLNRMIEFDADKSSLNVEAGVTLSDVLDVVVPRGFFPPVVPGTRFVTIGGMVAANVHGKNHHKTGGFGKYVERLTLITVDGARFTCSPHENASLFRATIGGMGLTGIILDVTFRLIPIQSAFVRNETIIAENLDAILRAFEESFDWTYTVAWVDCLAAGASIGRSILFRGEHARSDELSEVERIGSVGKRHPTRRVPFYLPNFTLNRWSVSAFNYVYRASQKPGTVNVPLMNYFFPLDSIDQWNRIYGKRGFLQYQCVIPKVHSRAALGEILELVSSRGTPSFLAVLKLLGADTAGLLSFPMEGYTLTLDLPATESTFQLLGAVDRVVMTYGGRIYLAKDARQNRELLERGYPDLEKFRTFRRNSGADEKFRSLQSERLAI